MQIHRTEVPNTITPNTHLTRSTAAPAHSCMQIHIDWNFLNVSRMWNSESIPRLLQQRRATAMNSMSMRHSCSKRCNWFLLHIGALPRRGHMRINQTVAACFGCHSIAGYSVEFHATEALKLFGSSLLSRRLRQCQTETHHRENATLS